MVREMEWQQSTVTLSLHSRVGIIVLVGTHHYRAPVTLDREVGIVAGIITIETPSDPGRTVAPDVGGDVVAVLQQFWPNNPALWSLVYRGDCYLGYDWVLGTTWLSEVEEEVLIVGMFDVDRVGVVGNPLVGEGEYSQGRGLFLC